MGIVIAKVRFARDYSVLRGFHPGIVMAFATLRDMCLA